MADLIGQRLGNCEILSLLGESDMATVYRARQLNIKRDVAIKVIESRLARNPYFVSRAATTAIRSFRRRRLKHLAKHLTSRALDEIPQASGNTGIEQHRPAVQAEINVVH